MSTTKLALVLSATTTLRRFSLVMLLACACNDGAVVLDRPDAGDGGTPRDAGDTDADNGRTTAGLEVAWDVDVPSPEGRVGSVVAASDGHGGVLLVGDRARLEPLWAQRIGDDGSLLWTPVREVLAAADGGHIVPIELVAQLDRPVLIATGLAQRVDADGSLPWGMSGVATTSVTPGTFAADGGGGVWLVGWSSASTTLLAEHHAAPDGAASGTITLSTESGLSGLASVGDGEGGVYVAWQTNELTHSELILARIAGGGLQWSAPVVVAPSIARFGTVVDAAGCWVWWVETTDGGFAGLRVQRVDLEGRTAGWTVNVAMVDEAAAVVAASDGGGGIGLLWRALAEAGAERGVVSWGSVALDGTVGEPKEVFTADRRITPIAVIRLERGDFVVPYTSDGILYAQRLDAAGMPLLRNDGTRIGSGTFADAFPLGSESIALVYTATGVARVARLNLVD